MLPLIVTQRSFSPAVSGSIETPKGTAFSEFAIASSQQYNSMPFNRVHVHSVSYHGIEISVVAHQIFESGTPQPKNQAKVNGFYWLLLPLVAFFRIFMLYQHINFRHFHVCPS